MAETHVRDVAENRPNVTERRTTQDATDTQEMQSESSGSRTPKKIIVVSVVALVLLAAGIWGFYHILQARHYVSTDDAFIDAHIIQISPQVAARVRAVLVNDNEEVEAGRLLVDLDPRDFEIKLAEAKAAEQSAQARLEQALAQQPIVAATTRQAEADMEAAAARAQNASNDLKRSQELASKKVISEREAENASALARSSNAAVEAAREGARAARAQSDTVQAQVKSSRAGVENSRVGIEQAALQLSYTKITAPAGARVTRKNVEPGSYVQIGDPLLALVRHDVWVVANFKETQLTHIRPGQPVEIKVDTFPSRVFHGHVDSIQAGTGARFSALPPENATGNYVKVVQRLPVKIVFDEPLDAMLPLAPGMSVVPRVKLK
jgi:membrane fusion protein (multidrug efflux system)